MIICMEEIENMVDTESLKWYSENYIPCKMLFQKEENGVYNVTDLMTGTTFKNKTFYFKDSHEKCRFCGKSAPEVTFKDKAHTIPEFIGNKLFVNKNNECDVCNHKFGEVYEPDLSAFLLPCLTIDQIRGKNGTRKYKSNDKKSIVSSDNGTLKIEEIADATKVIRDDGKKQITYQFDIPKYSMFNVYKSVLKMALSIIPEEKINLVKYKIKALNDANTYGDECFLFSFFPGFNRFGLNVLLYERKDPNNHNIPLFQFGIMSNNFMIQVPIFGDDDINQLQGKQITIPTYQIPTPHDKDKYFGDVKVKVFNKMDIVDRHTANVTLKYDSINEK